jgi:DNA-binding CsgD family transcriptional regulator
MPNPATIVDARMPIAGTLGTAVRERIAQTILDHLIHPLLVVSADGTVVHSNFAGYQFIAGRHGLQVRDGRLTTTRRGEKGALAELLIALSDPAARPAQPGVLTLPSRQGRNPKVMLLMPMRPTGAPSLKAAKMPERLVLIAVIDPPHRLLPDEHLVRSVYGLSAAETRIALKIAAGKSLSQIALESRTSLHTVRTQLKAIFAKTGTSRQAQLALTLSALAPAMLMAVT